MDRIAICSATSLRTLALASGALLALASASSQTTTLPKKHTPHKSTSHKTAAATTSHVPMSPERATAIQTALIRNGYLTGEPTGKWDDSSIAAMQTLQGDNGWQTKIVPDSRALIKLGLGPQAATAATPAANQ